MFAYGDERIKTRRRKIQPIDFVQSLYPRRLESLVLLFRKILTSIAEWKSYCVMGHFYSWMSLLCIHIKITTCVGWRSKYALILGRFRKRSGIVRPSGALENPMNVLRALINSANGCLAWLRRDAIRWGALAAAAEPFIWGEYESDSIVGLKRNTELEQGWAISLEWKLLVGKPKHACKGGCLPSILLPCQCYFHVSGSIGIVQKIDFEIKPDLGCTTPKTSRKVLLDNPSVCLSVWPSVCLAVAFPASSHRRKV